MAEGRITIDEFMIDKQNLLTRSQCDLWLHAIAHDEWWSTVYGRLWAPPANPVDKNRLRKAV